MSERAMLINALISEDLLDEACPSSYGLADNCNDNCRQCWSEALDKVLKEGDGE